MTLFQFLRWFCQLIHLGSYYKFLILMMYTLFGAWMFKTLESTPLTDGNGEGPALIMNEPQDAFNFLKNFQETATKMPDELLLQFITNQSEILFAAYKTPEQIEWTWCLGFFYSVETYTTIGYGYPVVRTWQARLATIIYAMIGVPFFLVYLASVGKTMSKTMARIDKRMRRTKFGKLLLYSRAPNCVWERTLGCGGQLLTCTGRGRYGLPADNAEEAAEIKKKVRIHYKNFGLPFGKIENSFTGTCNPGLSPFTHGQVLCCFLRF